MKTSTIIRISFYSLAGIAFLFLAFSFGTVHGFFRGMHITQASFTQTFTNTRMNNLELIKHGDLDSLKNSMETQLDLGLIILLGKEEIRSPWLVRANYYSNDEQLRVDLRSTLQRGAIYREANRGQLILTGEKYYQNLIRYLPGGSAMDGQ